MIWAPRQINGLLVSRILRACKDNVGALPTESMLAKFPEHTRSRGHMLHESWAYLG